MSKQYLINDSGIVFFSHKEGFVTIPKTAHYYDKLYAELMDDSISEEEFLDSIKASIKADIVKESDGAVKVLAGAAIFKDPATGSSLTLPPAVYEKMRELRRKGASYKHLVNFWRRCLCNPNQGSICQLFEFISRHLLTITDEGLFVAYKGVADDYRDKHSGKFDNHPGRVVEMPRDQVTYNPQECCSSGLHVANYRYAASWGERVVVVLVDPADVVSVPYDSNAEKIRVCRYTVQADYVPEHAFTDVGLVNRELKAQNGYTLAAERPWTDEEDRLVLSYIVSGRDNIEDLASKLRRSVESVKQQIAFLRAEENKHFEAAGSDDTDDVDDCDGRCDCCEHPCDDEDLEDGYEDHEDFCDEDDERDLLDEDLEDDDNDDDNEDDEPTHVTVIVSRLSDAQVKSLERLYKKYGKQWVTIAKAMGLPKTEADYLRKLVKRLESLGVIR